ncbi:AraC family transcriptional regulator [Massilia arenosa]|uniref:AraC family transcriptional regulator n=1 Tax=Zemynaea arenosa TaxID=2561931 RepID=A0A4Y9SDP0_9BURK|nr:GyrI-like domain-containing protein [Massilia arenosa]TFW20859.1 AraC family transcriptional regulator [Massilia arenosa]
MIDTPTIVQALARPCAAIRITIPRAQIREMMHPAMQEVMQVLAAQGVRPAGPMFSHHVQLPAETFDFAVGVPVEEPFTPAGRVQAWELPAARVARTVYHGGYEGLGDAWGELGQWVTAQGHTSAHSLWEFYAAGPESSADPQQWRTEFNWPLRD